MLKSNRILVAERNNKLETPLHVALSQNFISKKIVTLLLQSGASVITTDLQGRTCLQIAKDANNQQILEIVLTYYN